MQTIIGDLRGRTRAAENADPAASPRGTEDVGRHPVSDPSGCADVAGPVSARCAR